MAMTRVIVDGRVLNKRTADMLKCAENRAGFNMPVVQGSYNAGGVSASAGTHDGGGALDVNVDGWSNAKVAEAVYQLRKVGFAAWDRPTRPGLWRRHIHAIAIGDGELSSGARQQVQEYYAGYDGLAGNGRDNGPRFDPIPVWPINFPNINLTNVQRQFSGDRPTRVVLGVKRIQRLLNKRLNRNLVIDGKAGPKTRAAYKDWEVKAGSEHPNSVPGLYSLRKLVAGYYRVVK